MADAVEPIADEELLYRRVPAPTGWFDPVSQVLKPEAFQPHKTQDGTGLSISRARFKSAQQAAQGRPGKSYYVAVVRAGDLRQVGIAVVPQPKTPDGIDVAHAELPDLNSENYKATQTLERQRLLAQQLCLRVEGPFESPATP